MPQPASPHASPDHLSLMTWQSTGPAPRHPLSSQCGGGIGGPRQVDPRRTQPGCPGSSLIPRQTLSTTCHCLKFHHPQGPPRLQDKEGTPSLPPVPQADTWTQGSHTWTHTCPHRHTCMRSLPLGALPVPTATCRHHWALANTPDPEQPASVAKKGPAQPCGPSPSPRRRPSEGGVGQPRVVRTLPGVTAERRDGAQ